MRDAFLARDRYEPEYVPTALSEAKHEAVLRVRHDGFLLTTTYAGPDSVALSVRDAAGSAGTELRKVEEATPAWLSGLTLEIEVVGEAMPIAFDGDWTAPGALDAHIEPGVHGLALAGSTIQHRFCPTEVFTSDVMLSDALRVIAEKTHADPNQLKNTRLFRFRTQHWVQSGSDGAIVALTRGMTPVPPSAVSQRGLDDAIGRIAEYMAYRQRDDGSFSYQFEPGRDRYTDDDNLVRQAGAIVAMCVDAAWSGRSASLAAADAALESHLRNVRDVPRAEGASFIATPDGQHRLGVTALITLALAEHPQPEKYAEIRRRLIKGMLSLQRPSGMFVTAFPPALEIDAQDYYPGEALLALARQHALEPTGEVLDAFDRAIDFYRQYFRHRPTPAFVTWQVQAYARMADHTKRDDYVAYVFELTDWLAYKQLNRSNCPWPDLWGGIAGYAERSAGVSTASYLEAFADALRLARVVGDEPRVKRYEELARSAARFVLQLQFRPEEAYFVRSPRDAVGGIRTAPALNLMRIDHCQHALIALIKSRQTLFPDGR